MEGNYTYGKYKIKNDTVLLNKKEKILNHIFSDKFYISNIFDTEQKVEIFVEVKKLKYHYFVGEDNRLKNH